MNDKKAKELRRQARNRGVGLKHTVYTVGNHTRRDGPRTSIMLAQSCTRWIYRQLKRAA